MNSAEIYQNLYPINTNCKYDESQYQFFNLSETTFNGDSEILNFIKENRENILTSSSTEELVNLYKQIIPLNKLKHDILKYEFINGECQTKHSDIDQILDMLRRELKTYQWVVGGFEIEDMEWIECGSETRFQVCETQKAIYNTCEYCKSDKELKVFLDVVCSRIQKTILDNNIKLHYKIIIDNPLEINWVVIIVEKIE